jgi:hypothetical protein
MDYPIFNTATNVELVTSVKVGLLVNDLNQPAWVCWMIEKISELANVEVRLVVVCDRYDCLDMDSQNEPILYRTYRFITNLLSTRGYDAFEKKNIRYIMPCTRVVRYDDIQTVGAGLDIVIKLGRINKSAFTNVFCGGYEWSFVFGGVEYDGQKLPLVKDIVFGYKYIESFVVSRNFNGTLDIVCDPSFSPVDKRADIGNINQCIWKTAAFVPRKLKYLRM